MFMIFSVFLIFINNLVGVRCIFDSDNVVYQINKPYRKNTFVCDLNKRVDSEYTALNPYCFSNTYSFAFSLTIKKDRRSIFGSSSNLKSLITTLKDNVLCDLKHVKVSFNF